MTSGRTEQFPFSVCHGLSAAGGLSLPDKLLIQEWHTGKAVGPVCNQGRDF